MVTTREDKFGCIGDVCGATETLQFKEIPQNCMNAVHEGLRDTHRKGIRAWIRHDRFLYLLLAIATLAAFSGLIRRGLHRQSRVALQPHSAHMPDILNDYVLVPRRLNRF